MRWPCRLWVVLAVAGCVHRPVHVYPHMLPDMIGELRDGQSVEAGAHDAGVVVTRDTEVEVSLLSEDGNAWDRITLRLGELIEGCPPTRSPIEEDSWDGAVVRYEHTLEFHAAYPRCALLRASPDPIKLGEVRRANRSLIKAILGVAATGGVATCAFACDGSRATASKIALGFAGGALLVYGVVLFLYVRNPPT